MTTPKEIMDLLDAMRPPMPEGYEDWVYKDIPWCSAEYWNRFIDLLGPSNSKILVMSSRFIDGVEYLRGQMFISPQGMANIVKEIARLKETK